MAFKITLHSGRIINAEELSGDYFITSEKITANDFGQGELLHVNITGEITDENGAKIPMSKELNNAKLASIIEVDGKIGFYLYEPPALERKLDQMRADIEYTAMMNDVDLGA